MKTKEEKKKSNLWFMLLVLLLISVILCISSFGIATWARYRSVVGNNVVAQIAKWSFKVNGEEEQFANINLADTIAFEHVETTKIAPGTYGSFDLDIDARGSEVSLDYYININVAEKPTNLKFYSDSTHTTLIPISADNKIYLDGEFLLSNAIMQETRTIYWNWEYRTEEMPSATVLQGYYSSIEGLEALVNEYNDNGTTAGRKQELALKINDKIDTYEQGGDVLLEVRVKGVQINPNFSLKRAQITSGKSQTYNVGDQVNLSLEFTENVYGDNDGQSPVTNSNAPEVTLAFGGASANNPVAKVASLMSTNLKLSAGENVATFASVSGNKINYTYTIKSTDIGALRIANITGSVYNRDGKQINFGTVQTPTTSIPEVVGGTISAQVALTPTSTPTSTSNPSLVDLTIGDSVPFKTTLNNVNLNSWKVFYNDTVNGNVYLIFSGPLPNSAVNISGISKSGTYNVYSDNRNTLINAMTTKANWSQLVTNGKMNGNNINLTASETIYGMGSPTLDLFIKSWNVRHPEKTLYSKSNSTGYFVGTSSNPSTYDVETGITDDFYFLATQHQHYRLASPSANEAYYVMDVSYYSGVGYSSYDDTNLALRPVVCLPSSVFQSSLTPVAVTPQINVAGQTVTLTKENAADYYGKVVTNYTQANKTYRLFYVDFDGDFGTSGTVYLKADQVTTMSLNTTASASSTTALEKMKQMNPQWRDNDGTANNNNELGALWLCDETKWTNYKDDSKADYVIGAPSIEMYVKSYNAYHSKKGTSGYQQLNCKWFNKIGDGYSKGYMYAVGTSVNDSGYAYYTNGDTIKADENNMYVISWQSWWLASPSAYDANCICYVSGGNFYFDFSNYDASYVVSPLVSLRSDFTPEFAN